MKHMPLPCSVLFATVLFAGCSQQPKDATSTEANSFVRACDVGDVKLLADFSTSRMDICERVADNEFSITLKPENTPINSSPWYAFKAVAKQPVQIKITMQVEGDKHRYLPKSSTDLSNWSLLNFTDNDKSRSFSLDLTTGSTYIAGQEIIDNQYYVDWSKALEAAHGLNYDVVGESVQGRPIYKLESKTADNNKWLVVLGRMHPPELTGALALFPFVEALLSDSEVAKQFRSQYNIFIAPNINPDGVELGNWRHNVNGVDLNRDWNKFKQPEVIAIDNYLKQLVADGAQMSMAVDFHSTHRDIFYTMPNDYGVAQRYLVNNWLNSLDKQYPDFKVIQKPGNNPDLGVFKQYFADNFNVHAITYEMGDNTDRVFIKELATDAANELMKTMMMDNEVLKND